MIIADITIREPKLEDIPALRPILEYGIRSSLTGVSFPDEVKAVEESISASIRGKNTQLFLVAEEAGRLLGIMGIQPIPIDGRMRRFATTTRPVELVNAFVSEQHRKHAVGRLLVDALSRKAADLGSTQLIVNSGPRYVETGWPFWNKMFGESIGAAKDYYGTGRHAMVWSGSIHTDLD